MSPGSRIARRSPKALDELQAAMIVVPSEVCYQPKFTYIWTLAVGRFPDALRRRVNRAEAVREIARCFLAGAGMTIPGELARVTGLSRPEAGLGNRALVAEGYATRVARRHISTDGRKPIRRLSGRVGFNRRRRILRHTLVGAARHARTIGPLTKPGDAPGAARPVRGRNALRGRSDGTAHGDRTAQRSSGRRLSPLPIPTDIINKYCVDVPQRPAEDRGSGARRSRRTPARRQR